MIHHPLKGQLSNIKFFNFEYLVDALRESVKENKTTDCSLKAANELSSSGGCFDVKLTFPLNTLIRLLTFVINYLTSINLNLLYICLDISLLFHKFLDLLSRHSVALFLLLFLRSWYFLKGVLFFDEDFDLFVDISLNILKVLLSDFIELM